MKRSRLTIDAALLAIIVVVLTLVVGGLQAANYFETKQTIQRDLKLRTESIVERLSAGLVDPVWQMQKQQAATLVKEEMSDKSLYAVVVESTRGQVFVAMARDASWRSTPVEEPQNLAGDDLIAKTRRLTKADLPIGRMTVYLTDRFHQDRLDVLLARTLLSILVVNGQAIGILFFVIRGIVISPLRSLQRFANRVGAGNLDSPRPRGLHFRETADLNDAMWTMTRNLKQTIQALQDKEQELAAVNTDLEKMVAERTQDLAVKARELEAANVRLMALDEVKTAFLSTVSHDIRTPLTSVLGFAKLIEKDFQKHFMEKVEPGSPEAERGKRIDDNLRIIVKEGERLTRLINDFLDLSRIEAGQVEWHDTEIAVAEIIERAVQASSGQFAHNPAVSLTCGVQEDLPPLRIDPDRITQVMVNLLNNAAKFTSRGKVSISASRTNNSVRIEVADSGMGIPRSDQEKIFNKFQRANHGDTTDKKPKGTGLGLAICKQIVEHYKGRIWVESELGRGSRFIIVLPYGQAAA